MIKQLADSILFFITEEQRVGVANFLSLQNIEDKDEIMLSFSLIKKLYEKFPNLIFKLDYAIKTERFAISASYTNEQREDLSIIGVSAIEHTMSTMSNDLVTNIIEQLSESKTNYISTHIKFLTCEESKNVFDNRNEVRINLNFKILTVSDLRKMKLEKLKRNNYFNL